MFRFMFRFAERLRHLGEVTLQSLLWQYYKNYFHRNNHESYYRMAGTKGFALLEQESIV